MQKYHLLKPLNILGYIYSIPVIKLFTYICYAIAWTPTILLQWGTPVVLKRDCSVHFHGEIKKNKKQEDHDGPISLT